MYSQKQCIGKSEWPFDFLHQNKILKTAVLHLKIDLVSHSTHDKRFWINMHFIQFNMKYFNKR